MSQNRMTPKLWGMLLVLSCCWGGSFLFVEVALRNLVYGRVSELVWLRRCYIC